MKIRSIVGMAPWAVMTGLALFLFGITVQYWSFRPDINFLLVKQDVVFNPIWRTVFYLHVLAGMLSIAIGPFQFLKKFRQGRMTLHRKLGKVYMAAILLIGAPTGLYMSLYAEGGWIASLGFLAMSLAWFYTTFMAVKKVREKDIQGHIRWMMRSYAVTFSAVMLRLWVPILSLGLGWEHEFVVILTAWISWILNLFFVEFLIAIKPKSLTLKTVKP